MEAFVTIIERTENIFLRTLVAFSIAFLLSGVAFGKQVEIKVPGIDYAPISYHKNGKIQGFMVDIIKKIGEKLKLDLKEMPIPIDRLKDLNEEHISLFPIVIRSKEREEQGFRWVGEIFEDHYCFLTLKSSPTINSVEDANKLAAIGVNRGGATEKKAQAIGIKNSVIATGNSGNVRKLFAKKIDGWFIGDMVGTYSISEEGLDSKQTVCTGDYGKISYWFAASKKMDNELYNNVKAAFEEEVKLGNVATQVKKHFSK